MWRNKREEQLNVLVGSSETLRTFRGCHIMAVKLPREMCATQAVCETSELVNGADKGLQAMFDCCHKITKTGKTVPESSMITWSAFFSLCCNEERFVALLIVSSSLIPEDYSLILCFWSPLLTSDRKKKGFFWMMLRISKIIEIYAWRRVLKRHVPWEWWMCSGNSSVCISSIFQSIHLVSMLKDQLKVSLLFIFLTHFFHQHSVVFVFKN